MSSTEVAVSPTKKKTKQQNMEQIVSSGQTNGCNDECYNESESESQQTLINNLNDTNNKECHVNDDDACMEPLLIQDCANDNDEKFVVTNPINTEINSVHSDDNNSSSSSDMPFNDQNSPNDDGGGGGGGENALFAKPNLCLNLANDDKIPKNKKFLDSSEDQIMNQIFFQTISVTPTTEEEILGGSKFSESTPDERLQPVDFFNRKIDEDDTTYTDTADNYQEENDGNLCSLNDNFNDNYCSFSSIDYNPTNIRNNKQQQQDEAEVDSLLQPDTFLGEYAEQMRKQRPSIVIDCYDDSDNSKATDDEENDKEAGKGGCQNEKKTAVASVVIGSEKINDYCFYFDQTIEEDDDDAYINDGSASGEGLAADSGDLDLDVDLGDEAVIREMENGKTLDHDVVMMQGEEDECFETEEEEEEEDEDEDEGDDYGNENATNNDDSEKSVTDDEGVINESVNVSGHTQKHSCYFIFASPF